MLLGDRLKKLRLERRLTMQEVAIKIGLAKSSYAGYEAGQRKPPLDKLVILAQLYQVSTDFLLGLTNITNTVNSLHKKNLHWENISLNEKELEVVSQIVELMVEKKDEKTTTTYGETKSG